MNLRAKLSIAGEPVGRGGGVSSWNDIENKPFSTVDTENGLTIQDDTLMIDTLDHIATIDYVDQQIADIDLSDYATKSELDAVEAEIPSLTGYATEQYVDTAISSIPDPTWNDIQNKPTFATVATSGDYDDLSNKPTIPSIDGLATETYVNNVIAAIDIPEDVSELNNDAGYITSSALSGYATEQYVDDAIADIPAPTVEIDNKSIIKNQDGELQTAVPAYRELVSETDEGLYFDTFTYPSGNDLDVILNTGGTHITLDTSDDAYTVKAVIDGVEYTGNWTASPNSTIYEYGGNSKWKVTSPVTGNYELYWQWRNDTEYKIHIYMGGNYIQRDKVSELIIVPNNSGDTLLSQLEALQLDNYIGTIKTYNYHKIPAEYLDIDTTITPEDLVGSGTTGVLRGGPGINLGKASSGSTQYVNVSQNYNEVMSCVSSVNQIIDRLETAFTEPDYNYSRSSSNFYFNYKTDGTLPMYESSSVSVLGNWKSVLMTLTSNGFKVSMLIDPVNKTIQGYEKFCDSYEYFIGDGTTEHNGKIYLNGYPYIIFINPKWGNITKVALNAKVYGSLTADASFAWNTLQPYNIPIDNETLEITNGKIKTAIPAPPTTDGNYTLAVTVTNGEPTYSWV